SRRRHTRSKRDWSSDVCSSDLFCSRYKMNQSHNLLSFPLKKFYHKVKLPSLRVFFNPDDLHRFIKYVPMYIFSMISHTKTKELIYMPNKTENIGSKKTPHEDGRREGMLYFYIEGQFVFNTS